MCHACLLCSISVAARTNGFQIEAFDREPLSSSGLRINAAADNPDRDLECKEQDEPMQDQKTTVAIIVPATRSASITSLSLSAARGANPGKDSRTEFGCPGNMWKFEQSEWT